jgi:hypothetical protein
MCWRCREIRESVLTSLRLRVLSNSEAVLEWLLDLLYEGGINWDWEFNNINYLLQNRIPWSYILQPTQVAPSLWNYLTEIVATWACTDLTGFSQTTPERNATIWFIPRRFYTLLTSENIYSWTCNWQFIDSIAKPHRSTTQRIQHPRFSVVGTWYLDCFWIVFVDSFDVSCILCYFKLPPTIIPAKN